MLQRLHLINITFPCAESHKVVIYSADVIGPLFLHTSPRTLFCASLLDYTRLRNEIGINKARTVAHRAHTTLKLLCVRAIELKIIMKQAHELITLRMET